MSEGVNKVLLVGNIGNDPELKFTQGGTAVLSFSLATNDSYLDRDKQRQERCEWHNIVVWSKRGEGLAKFLKKGFGVFIEGALRTRTWDDRDGRKCYRTEIHASNVIVTRGDPPGQRQGQTQHRQTHASDYTQGSRDGYGAPRQQQTPQAQQPANDAPPDDFGYDDGGDGSPF
jgi:single-strand DNA-binding protein